MEGTRDPIRDVAEAVCDGLRQIGDFSYAMMPRDIAHALGDFKRAFWSQVKDAIDWEIDWTEARVAGGDRLRDEWREKCSHNASDDVPPAAV